MTARQLIQSLQDLGEENLDRDVIMFDGPALCTPYKVAIIEDNNWGKKLQGKIMID